ncbi:transmembrane protein [Podospora appendiculata]|uniref:Store-operated calcium entry-associated regulatory factor n=1 Tax=Podospora appendiculata TaxID=314037 RepID=A0AAE0XGG2_9PEZI|nr:transmembrane protein [Podospora appendiculata]
MRLAAIHDRPFLPLLLALQLLPTASLAARSSSSSGNKNAILLSDVQSLTLRANQPTTHRRVPAIPQLKCISSRALCALHAVDTMRCVNQGSGYTPEDIQWACTASLPATLKLGSTDVICEGYAGPDDPYVLRGSCGAEYRLVLTDEGERRYPDLGRGGSGSGGGDGQETDWAGYLFGLIFFGVLAWIVWSACVQADANRRVANGQPPRRGWGGGGGGGGWGGWGGGGPGPWNDPPPPYPGTKPATEQGGWRPGFWSGVAGGAAAGYLAGNRGGRRDNGYGYDSGQGGYGSTWGSNRGGSGSSGSSSSSGAARESTGFGSTSRR